MNELLLSLDFFFLFFGPRFFDTLFLFLNLYLSIFFALDFERFDGDELKPQGMFGFLDVEKIIYWFSCIKSDYNRNKLVVFKVVCQVFVYHWFWITLVKLFVYCFFLGCIEGKSHLYCPSCFHIYMKFIFYIPA